MSEFRSLILFLFNHLYGADMPSLLTGAVMGVAPDARIEIPDEHTMQILQTRDNYVQVSCVYVGGGCCACVCRVHSRLLGGTFNSPITTRFRSQNTVSLLYAIVENAHSLSIFWQERANAMQNIEATIEEIGGIFQQLATMVAEQGETVERIDREVDHTVRLMAIPSLNTHDHRMIATSTSLAMVSPDLHIDKGLCRYFCWSPE